MVWELIEEGVLEGCIVRDMLTLCISVLDDPEIRHGKSVRAKVTLTSPGNFHLNCIFLLVQHGGSIVEIDRNW